MKGLGHIGDYIPNAGEMQGRAEANPNAHRPGESEGPHNPLVRIVKEGQCISEVSLGLT